MHSFEQNNAAAPHENKYEFSLREDKSFSLQVILRKEIDFQNDIAADPHYQHVLE